MPRGGLLSYDKCYACLLRRSNVTQSAGYLSSRSAWVRGLTSTSCRACRGSFKFGWWKIANARGLLSVSTNSYRSTREGSGSEDFDKRIPSQRAARLTRQ